MQSFLVGDVVMFFMNSGAIIDPPNLEEIADRVLQGVPCGTVVSVQQDQILVRLDDGSFMNIVEKDWKKLWFLTGPVVEKNQPMKAREDFLSVLFLLQKAKEALNIRRI